MQTHKAVKVLELLNTYLPWGYSQIVVDRAKSAGIITTNGVVRNVKCFFRINIQILNIIIEVAKEHQSVAETEAEKLSKI
ncbi:hypothetical protein [Sediminibacter sp. Hel_I_10]|uniref:hypothetical protein n=1 Tax=Sediminibacter sp. Hel_I_10 TaxID=1392490 RepID=UPI0012DCD1E5|nr:hypothetical protein [Sediminibacter sp. Hel_I_10]